MPAIPARPKSPQAPIFQRSPDLVRHAEAAEAERKARIQARRDKVRLPPIDIPAQTVKLALVTPLSIFAAGRDSFDCITRPGFSKIAALTVIFAHLPMEENGWEFDHTDINLAGHRNGSPVWRVSRERSFMADPDTQAEQKALAPSMKSLNSTINNLAGRGL